MAKSFILDDEEIVGDNVKNNPIAYMFLVRDNWDQISAYKEAIANEDYGLAYTHWTDIDEYNRNILQSLAPTKGGVLTTFERDIMKKNEWAAARNELMK